MKTLIILFYFLLSMPAHSYIIAGESCLLKKGQYQLNGYLSLEHLNPRYLDMTEDEIIADLDGGPFPIDIEKILKIKNNSIIIADKKLRLQKYKEEICEGVFLFEDEQSYWISGDVFSSLQPYEKVIVYLEIFNQRYLPKSEISKAKAAYPLTHFYKIKNRNEFLKYYNNFLKQVDENFYIDGYFFYSNTLTFSESSVIGRLSKLKPYITISGRDYNLSDGIVTLTEGKIRKIKLAGPSLITIEAGKFRPSTIYLDENENLECALLSKRSFLKNIKGDVEIFEKDETICFQDDLVSERSPNR